MVRDDKPLVYSCSGAAGVAQMANAIAVRLHREGRAEMGCIMGVAARIPALLDGAHSGRSIVALDGCSLHCVRTALGSVGIVPTVQHTFSDYGVTRSPNLSFDEAEAERVRARVVETIEAFCGEAGPPTVPDVWTASGASLEEQHPEES